MEMETYQKCMKVVFCTKNSTVSQYETVQGSEKSVEQVKRKKYEEKNVS